MCVIHAWCTHCLCHTMEQQHTPCGVCDVWHDTSHTMCVLSRMLHLYVVAHMWVLVCVGWEPHYSLVCYNHIMLTCISWTCPHINPPHTTTTTTTTNTLTPHTSHQYTHIHIHTTHHVISHHNIDSHVWHSRRIHCALNVHTMQNNMCAMSCPPNQLTYVFDYIHHMHAYMPCNVVMIVLYCMHHTC